MSQLPHYAVVVVTWRCAGELATLVESMNEQLASTPQLVVVDNASDDDPRAALSRWRGPQTFVALAKNVGYGRANNIGVRAADGDAVVLLNPDTELLDGGLDRLVAEALARRTLVGPRLRDPDGGLQPSAGGDPTGAWPWIGALVPPVITPAAMVARTEPWRLACPTQVAWLTGACIAAPRDLLLALGPFDPDIELYGEDMDLCLRAARAGAHPLFAPQLAEVRHAGDASSRRRFGDDARRALKTTMRRLVVRRMYGARAETRAWRAERMRLRLRIAARWMLRMDAERDRRELAAVAAARELRVLAPLGDLPARATADALELAP